MKKLLCTLVFIILLAVPAFALAESTVSETSEPFDVSSMTLAELTALVDAANARIDELTPKPTPEPFTTYQKGSKGDGVKAVQLRLIELKFLIGTADGAYGDKSVAAITDFQKASGIIPTGIADSDTQEVLFSDDAIENPEPPFDLSSYEKLNYKAVARDPDAYEWKLVFFSGKVIQVLEGDTSSDYRIATKGNYDDVVLVSYTRPTGASRILEDDRVTVYGVCLGVYSYKSTGGATITIPAAMATRIELK